MLVLMLLLIRVFRFFCLVMGACCCRSSRRGWYARESHIELDDIAHALNLIARSGSNSREIAKTLLQHLQSCDLFVETDLRLATQDTGRVSLFVRNIPNVHYQLILVKTWSGAWRILNIETKQSD